jgi:hypothetical protein
MDHEIREMDKQEKQITMELKQRAKMTNNSKDTALTALAKQLVQVRKQRVKLMAAKAHIGAVGMHATSMASQVAAASAIGSVTNAMSVVNATTIINTAASKTICSCCPCLWRYHPI